MTFQTKKKYLNITIYTTSGFPYGMAAENFIRQVALGLKANNVPVNVVLLYGENPRNAGLNDTGIKTSNLLIKKRLNGIFSVIYIFMIPLLFPYSLLKNKIINKTNTVILNGVNFAYWGAPIIFICRLLKIKVYSIETERYLRKYFGKEWWKYPRWLSYKLQYQFFDKFLNGKICLSTYLINDAIRFGIKPNRLILIPHFVDTDRFYLKSVIPDQRYFTIGYSGVIYSLNGIYILINAFKMLLKKVKNARLLLIGTTINIEEQKFMQLTSDIREYIIFPGMVPSKDVPKLLNTCDVLVNPREKSILADSGFPTKVGEYLATGKVVVSSRTGDLETYFQNHRDIYYFESGNSEELSNILLFIYNNKESAKEVAINGRIRATKKLDYRKSAEKLISFVKY